MKKFLLVGAVFVAAMFVVTACGDDSDDSVESATADFCSAAGDVAQDVAALGDVGSDTSVDDAQTAVDNLQSAVDSMESAASDLGQEKVDATKSAFDDMKSAIEGISGSDSLADAATEVTQARDTFVKEFNEIQASNCVTNAVEESTTTSG